MICDVLAIILMGGICWWLLKHGHGPDMETSLSDENRGISHFKSRHSLDDILISFLLRDPGDTPLDLNEH